MKPSVKTYAQIVDEFYESTDIMPSLVADARPCMQPYFRINVPEAIIVWLNDGSKMIYIPKE